MPPVNAGSIDGVFRREAGPALATLIRLLGDFDLAEESLQEAFRIAVETWETDGPPANPRAWLVSTARHKGIDAIRRDSRRRELIHEHVQEKVTGPEPWDGDQLQDDQLRLIFTCCHPLLPLDSRIALSLREVCGLTTEEIAHAYFVPADTMRRRISRAKQIIREKRIPYRIPARSDLPERLDAVLHVAYLVYNEGYATSAGVVHTRTDLRNEGIFLARLIASLVSEPDAVGLLALLLLHESRAPVRTDAEGIPVPLERQDRSRWDRSLISEAFAHLQRAMFSGTPGPYTIQAAIASVHAVAESVETTNWAMITEYYDALLTLMPSPVVELNRAIAVSMRDSPRAGLEIIDRLIEGGPLTDYHIAHAARADLLRRAGDVAAACEEFRAALALARQEPERRFLERRLSELRAKVEISQS